MGCSSSSTGLAVVRDFHERYTLGVELGHGSFGQVHVATRGTLREPRAVKIVSLAAKTELLERAKAQAVHLELSMWRRVGRHENCVQLFESFQDLDRIFMVMEKCHLSLASKVSEMPSTSSADYRHLVRGMVSGVAHLHHRRIAHRDVKLQNFLLGGPRHRTVKLCDFGLAVVIPKDGCRLYGRLGTTPYMSPEMASNSGHRLSTDLWSLGVTCYALLFGVFPFQPLEKDSRSLLDAIIHASPAPTFCATASSPPWLAQEPLVHEFVQDLLQYAPYDRPTAEEALRLPFLASPGEVGRRPLTKTRLLALLTELLGGFGSPRAGPGTLGKVLRLRELKLLGQVLGAQIWTDAILARYGCKAGVAGITEMLVAVEALLCDPDVLQLWSKIEHVAFAHTDSNTKGSSSSASHSSTSTRCVEMHQSIHVGRPGRW